MICLKQCFIDIGNPGTVRPRAENVSKPDQPTYSMTLFGSNGRTNDTKPITINSAQQTQIGTGVVTSAKVAIKGAERDAIRLAASVRPQPMARCLSGMTSGVYLIG